MDSKPLMTRAPTDAEPPRGKNLIPPGQIPNYPSAAIMKGYPHIPVFSCTRTCIFFPIVCQFKYVSCLMQHALNLALQLIQDHIKPYIKYVVNTYSITSSRNISIQVRYQSQPVHNLPGSKCHTGTQAQLQINV